eukprot:NODE_4904_length_618_cov_12.525483_g4222_i0.p2 GENE.NODE_4904_length_618_cov_12.525483_g4222_i0~~NODE_4904_length_618_cov_12.525483_g4222_i0.p2  ORF type:complete len:109 (+),score=7.71 NODE_4904_length_618_cov_12.525483_g4222_i0:224-550(+)
METERTMAAVSGSVLAVVIGVHVAEPSTWTYVNLVGIGIPAGLFLLLTLLGDGSTRREESSVRVSILLSFAFLHLFSENVAGLTKAAVLLLGALSVGLYDGKRLLKDR